MVARSQGPTIREQLLTGARAHIREHGIADLSTRTLAAAGGRSTMCLYTKFTNRQGLLDAVLADEGQRLLGQLGAAADPVRAYWDFGIAEPGLYAFLFSGDPRLIGIDPDARAALVVTASAALERDTPTGPAGHRWALLHGMLCFAQAGGSVDIDQLALVLDSRD